MILEVQGAPYGPPFTEAMRVPTRQRCPNPGNERHSRDHRRRERLDLYHRVEEVFRVHPVDFSGLGEAMELFIPFGPG